MAENDKISPRRQDGHVGRRTCRGIGYFFAPPPIFPPVSSPTKTTEGIVTAPSLDQELKKLTNGVRVPLTAKF